MSASAAPIFEDKLISHVCWYEPASLSFVAQTSGREVRLFSISSGDISHVADFDFDSEVLAVHVCSITKGVVVTSVNCTGVGWSWIDGEALSVEKTEFRKFFTMDLLDAQQREISYATVTFIEMVNRFVLSFGSGLFLTSEVERFACEIVVQTSLPSLTGLSWGGKGVLLYNLRQYGVDGVLKGDSERPQDEYLITRAMRAGGEDSSVLLECMHAKNKHRCLRWCELECESNWGNKEKETSGAVASTTASPDQKGKEPVLRVHWELPLPEGTSMAVEPYNNDGQDSRKLVYVATALGVIHILNVNGPVCSYLLDLAELTKPLNTLHSPCSALKKDSGAGLNVTGLMVRELPLGNEKRRQAVLSLSNGCYVSAQMDVVASVDQAVVDGEQGRRGGTGITRRVTHVAKVTARPAHSLLQDWECEEEEGGVHGDVKMLLPYSHELTPLHVHDPEGIDADPNMVLVLARCWGQGRQLLRLVLPSLEDASRLSAAKSSMTKSKLMQRLALSSRDSNGDPAKEQLGGMSTQLPVLQPRAHYLSGPLDAVAPVSMVVSLSPSTYNTGVPSAIVAAGPPQRITTTRPNPATSQSSGIEERKDGSQGGPEGPTLNLPSRVSSTMSTLYGCQYGLSVDTNACAHVPVEADVALGMQLLAPNYSYAGSSNGGARPLLITSRAARSTSLVLLDPAHPQLFLEQPEELQEQAELSIEMDRDAPQPDQDQPPAGKEEGCL